MIAHAGASLVWAGCSGKGGGSLPPRQRARVGKRHKTCTANTHGPCRAQRASRCRSPAQPNTRTTHTHNARNTYNCHESPMCGVQIGPGHLLTELRLAGGGGGGGRTPLVMTASVGTPSTTRTMARPDASMACHMCPYTSFSACPQAKSARRIRATTHKHMCVRTHVSVRIPIHIIHTYAFVRRLRREAAWGGGDCRTRRRTQRASAEAPAGGVDATRQAPPPHLLCWGS
jgi:hypothetical protein